MFAGGCALTGQALARDAIRGSACLPFPDQRLRANDCARRPGTDAAGVQWNFGD